MCGIKRTITINLENEDILDDGEKMSLFRKDLEDMLSKWEDMVDDTYGQYSEELIES